MVHSKLTGILCGLAVTMSFPLGDTDFATAQSNGFHYTAHSYHNHLGPTVEGGFAHRFGRRHWRPRIFVGGRSPLGAVPHDVFASPSFLALESDTFSTPITAFDSQYRKPKSFSPSKSGQFKSLKLDSIEQPTILCSAAASNYQGHAEKAFRQGRYEYAGRLNELALDADPQNGQLWLFAVQANFAAEKYRLAALSLNKATQLLPRQQWRDVVLNFRNFYGQNDFTGQVDALERYVRRRPEDGAAKTLLGYQYGSLGYGDAANQLFRDALEINPHDELAARLIPLVGQSGLPVNVSTRIDLPTPPRFRPHTIPSGQGSQIIFLTPQVPPTAPGPVEDSVPSVIEHELPPGNYEQIQPLNQSGSPVLGGPGG